MASQSRCMRHFIALMRKNFILWIRTPVRSISTLICPIILMAALAVIRHSIPYTFVDEEGMLEKKFFVYPGTTFDNETQTWYGDTHQNSYLDSYMAPWAQYIGYDRGHGPDDYSVGFDAMGPQFLYPTQCVKQFSWLVDRKPSPGIAAVGEYTQGSTAEFVVNRMQSYFQAIKKIQKQTSGRFFVPKYISMDYPTKTEFFNYLESDTYMQDENDGVCMGFEMIENAPNDYQLKIFLNDQNFLAGPYAYAIPPQSNPVVEPFDSSPKTLDVLRYNHNGFGLLEMLAVQGLIQQKTGQEAFISQLYQPLPTDQTVQDPFSKALKLILPAFLLIAFIPPIYDMVFRIVKEREGRAKESMRIMGMTDLPYWMSWFVYYTCINTLMSTLAWISLLFNVINWSNPVYIWLFFWLYGQAVFGQVVFLQSLFSTSKYAGIVSTVVYFGIGLFANFLLNANPYASRGIKLTASLIPQVSLFQGCTQFAEYEASGSGINSSTAANEYQNYDFNSALAMLAASFFFFFTLGLYLDKVVPNSYGKAENICFCILPSFWGCGRRNQRVLNEEGEEVADQDQEIGNEDFENFEKNQLNEMNYECPPVSMKRLERSGDFLKIQNLQKTYDGGFQAVKGVNLKMYEGQVFALLGHNGAGKSTIISMLTGLIGKSEGEASIYGNDLFEEMDQVREFMGICPQHDVLFDLLTPREHLEIFYDFKGGDPAKKSYEIESLIADVGLTIDQNKKACQLSGGNKRKLSVAIALCGGSKLVLLDEPTSGMDLGARRGLWDMLKNYKRDRIIILTTHYMDEADVLGDRIGIMARGQLMCIGTSLFLKNRFGLGYKLTLVKKHAKAKKALEPYLTSYFEGIVKNSEVRGEVSYVIPRDQTSAFKAFFHEFDNKLDEFDIKSYGVSMTTLEEVFLRINQELAPEVFEKNSDFSSNQSISDDGGNDKENNAFAHSIGHSTFNKTTTGGAGSDLGSENGVGMRRSHLPTSHEEEEDAEANNLVRGSNCCTTMEANTTKRFQLYGRDCAGFFCQILIPAVLVTLGLFFTSMPSQLSQSPARPLSTGWYPNQRVLINDSPLIQGTNPEADVTGQEFMANMPNTTDSFWEPEYLTDAADKSYVDYYTEVFEKRNSAPLAPYRYGSYQIYRANKEEQVYQIASFLNVTSQDVAGMFPHYMYQSILRVATGDANFKFEVINEPFPVFYSFKSREAAARSFDYTLMVSIALALIPCVMVAFILNEREYELKHQQLVSGMSLAGYWAANMFCDMLSSYIPMILIIILTKAFGVTFPGISILYLLFPLAIVPFSYNTTHVFKTDTTAQILTLFIHFFGGCICSLTVFALQLYPTTAQVGDILRWVFCVLPSFCVTHGIIVSANGKALSKARSENNDVPRPLPEEPWAFYNLKGDAVALLAHFLIGLLLLVLFESQGFKLCCEKLSNVCCCKGREKHADEEDMILLDEDVLAEEERVENQGKEGYRKSANLLQSAVVDDDIDNAQLLKNGSSVLADMDDNRFDAIRVCGFSKDYTAACSKSITAVTRVSFGLDYGECFALLGVNGAGKSTTFKSLTRDILPTTGEISIAGIPVGEDFDEARKLIGYCPQYDAIFPNMSVDEHLKYYSVIKGIPEHRRSRAIEKAIHDLNLKDHRDKLAGTLSGGNKRKLSVAIAIIGNPPIILLDEPSAGMDPEARRFMWSVVEKISQRDKKSAVILTSHSMEEAEALSTKMGIMVRGGIFRCFGPSQHIKNKFGMGYEVEVKIKKVSERDFMELKNELMLENLALESKVSLTQMIQDLRNFQGSDLARYMPILSDQIKDGGLGDQVWSEADLNGDKSVLFSNLLRYFHSVRGALRSIDYLLKNFDQVEILEHCGEYFKLRIPKEDKTIGWLFGYIEEKKDELQIQEYSVSQTSLEQIFQNFANNNLMDKAAFSFQKGPDQELFLVNPNRETTLDQQQLSQRGMSMVEDDLLSQHNQQQLQQIEPEFEGQNVPQLINRLSEVAQKE